MVCVGCVRLDEPTLFLRRFCRFVVLEQDGLGIQWWWVLAEEQGLDLDELNVAFFFTGSRFRGDLPVVGLCIARGGFVG